MGGGKKSGATVPRPISVIAIVLVGEEVEDITLFALDGAETNEQDGEIVSLEEENQARPEAFFNFHHSAQKTELTSWGSQAAVVAIAGIFAALAILVLLIQR
jgi:hypothetical protein